MQVMVSTPAHAEGQRYPVLIALHGRGEAMKGPMRGSRGFIDDYGLYKAMERLKAPPLTSKDFGGMVDAERLGRLNEALAKKPYEGLIVVCPYTPDLLAGERAFEAAEPFGRFLVETLLPRVYRELPAIGTPQATGIDGVSLGGRAALLVAFDHPKVFGAVGALQAAFDAKEIPKLVELAAKAKKQSPTLDVRLLTSDADYFLDVNEALSSALGARKVAHTLTVVRGDHSYEFNRGPGVYEMLAHHHWVLRGYPAP
jgi:enterochelin esterase-like enzyme